MATTPRLAQVTVGTFDACARKPAVVAGPLRARGTHRISPEMQALGNFFGPLDKHTHA